MHSRAASQRNSRIKRARGCETTVGGAHKCHRGAGADNPYGFSTTQKRLLDRSQPLAKRMRVVCSLRAVAGQGTVEALASCLDDESALLRHEVAYALGQKEEASAVGVLIKALREDQDSMVRHEAAEALGAINVAEAEKVLEEFENCDCEPLAHTCQLALDRIRWSRSKKNAETNGEGANLNAAHPLICFWQTCTNQPTNAPPAPPFSPLVPTSGSRGGGVKSTRHHNHRRCSS